MVKLKKNDKIEKTVKFKKKCKIDK